MNNINWKPFLISFIAVFMMVTLYKLGVRTDGVFQFPQFFYTVLSGDTYTKILNPQPNPQDSFENIKPKLQQQKNDFEVKKSSGIISKVNAEGGFSQANGYAVVDFDSGQVLASGNLDKKLAIASITKVMSAVVALDLAKPTDEFMVSNYAASIEPTKIEVIPGQKLTVEELLNAALLTSANDAVEVIKEGIDKKYGQGIFIRSMNEKARFINLKNTNFENGQGFDDKNHYSSVEDVVILTRYAIKNYPLIAEIVKKDYQFLAKNENHKQYDLYNWNGLINVYPGTLGVKIGNTDSAGFTTSVVSERGGKKLIAVLLGAPGVIERDMWTAELLDLGFQESLGINPVNLTEENLQEKYSTWRYW